MSLSLMRWASLVMLGMQASQVSAISQISAVGAKFFNSSGDQFYIKGAYLSIRRCASANMF
jgi:hypothetical protein